MKPTAALAFVVVLLLAAAAESSYRPTYEEEDESSSCRREMQQHSINQCRSFMKHGRSQGRLIEMAGGSSGNVDEEEENEGAAPEECCRQLRRVREECRCPMIRDEMQRMREEEGFTGRECRGRCGEMMMRGRFLPAMCNMEPHTCRMRQGAGY